MPPIRALARRRLPAALAVPLLLVSAAMAGQGTLIVLNKSEATASFIDLEESRIVATAPTGKGPHEAVVSPDGRLAVVADYGVQGEPGSTLTVLDVPAAEVARTIELGEHRRPHGIVWLGGGSEVAVTVEASRALAVVDVEAGKVTRTISTGQEVSHMVAVTPDGRRAFVANIGSGSVTALDLREGKHLKDVPTGAGAEGIDITPDGTQVWVTNRSADTVTVLDAAGLEILGEMNLRDPEDPESKPFPIRARVTPDGKHVLVSNANAAEVAVFDVGSRKLLRRIPMKLSAENLDGRLFGGRFGESSVPIGILIPPDGRRAYIANANADQVSVLDLQEWKLVGNLRTGREPDGMAWSPLRVNPAVRGEAPGGGTSR